MADKPRPVTATTAPQRVDKSEPAAEVAPAAQVAPTQAAAPAAPVGPAQAVGAPSRSERVQSVARRLRSGELTVAQAVEELIDDAVRTNLPNAQSERLEARLRAALRSYVQEDPFLAARVQRLSSKR